VIYGTWKLIDSFLPVEWSDAVEDVFTTAHQKRAHADNLSRVAAAARMDLNQQRKQVQDFLHSYPGAYPDPEIWDGLNALSENVEYWEARVAELRQKANKK
jgi:hypothetical protein